MTEPLASTAPRAGGTQGLGPCSVFPGVPYVHLIHKYLPDVWTRFPQETGWGCSAGTAGFAKLEGFGKIWMRERLKRNISSEGVKT